MNLKRFGMECSQHNWSIISAFCGRDWRKSRKPSVRITGVPNEIRTGHLPNTIGRVDMELWDGMSLGTRNCVRELRNLGYHPASNFTGKARMLTSRKLRRDYEGRTSALKPLLKQSLEDQEWAGSISLRWSHGTNLWMRKLDEAGSGSCPVAGFGISGAEPSGSATRELHSFLLYTVLTGYE
jgi:hypothetical protein